MRLAHASESGSFDLSAVMNSLDRKDPELGDSEGERRRIESVRGTRDVVREKKCASGLALAAGMGCVIVGRRAVGGS